MNFERAHSPAYRLQGDTGTLPAPLRGSKKHAPAELAAHIQRLQYPRVREGHYVTSDILRPLVNRPARRVPMLRLGVHWDTFTLEDQIAGSASHAEAICMFMVGRRRHADLECISCQCERGVFPFCVVVDYENGSSGCANCHWNEVQCSVGQSPSSASQPPPDPRCTHSHQASRDQAPHSAEMDAIFEGLRELQRAFNSLEEALQKTEKSAIANETVWVESNDTMSEIISQSNGPVLRHSDTQMARGVAEEGEAIGRTVVIDLGAVMIRAVELEIVIVSMEGHLRQLRRQ
ncbi:hypothetical protein N7517_006392 [Penicillium concentricum]|uniref:Uncharacterized protein n=1 Tax=Penicillium concentricum TaxID=293559 RepID=A0A9W9S978_9EURO|nr:uncharacterized protein N7517_006392 [Penicillium concentricum]KAJ5374386.1 hypothetical protein N7517_006392 [Penicillium concentricum]